MNEVWAVEVTYPHMESRIVYCSSKESSREKVKAITTEYAPNDYRTVFDDITGSVFEFPHSLKPTVIAYKSKPPEGYVMKWEKG